MALCGTSLARLTMLQTHTTGGASLLQPKGPPSLQGEGGQLTPCLVWLLARSWWRGASKGILDVDFEVHLAFAAFEGV